MVRIRKNLKLSPNFPDVAHRDLLPHICKLNQSPWDYYSPSSSFNLLDSFSSSSPPLLLQFQSGEGLVGNGSLGRSSITALQSVASPMDIDKQEVAVAAGDAFNNVEKVIAWCQRTDGRSWQCKKEAKEGSLLCDHHLRRSSIGLNSKVTSKNCNILPSDLTGSNPDNSVVPAKNRRGRPKSAKKGAIPNGGKPIDFYYYSGFGPSERNRNKKGKMVAEKDENTNNDPQPSSLPQNVGNGGHLDYMEDDFDDEDGSDEEGGGGGGCSPRRMRRPVKARSLMSIINVRAN